jgi:hypothetical protein
VDEYPVVKGMNRSPRTDHCNLAGTCTQDRASGDEKEICVQMLDKQ